MNEPALRYREGDPIAFRVLNEIGIIAQLSRALLEAATPDGLSGAGFSVLNHLARLPGDWSPARLANAFQVTKGAMTNTLQRLEAAGHVRVDPDPADARAKIVRLLKPGLKARDATLARLGPAMAALGAQLPADDFEALLAPLARLRAALDAARD
jgi:DNA-binding MarR family transcriptional regulator